MMLSPPSGLKSDPPDFMKTAPVSPSSLESSEEEEEEKEEEDKEWTPSASGNPTPLPRCTCL